MSPSTHPWLGGTVRPSPGNRTCARVPCTGSGPSTSINVAGGMSTTRLADASKADHKLPDLTLVSQTTGGSTPPTSLALIQPTPGWRVSPSPPYWTNSQSGRLSTCFSVVHCGNRVKTTESSVGPERNAVSVWFLTHCAVRSDLTESSSAWPAGLRVGTTTGCGGATGAGVGTTTTGTLAVAATGAAITAPEPIAATGAAGG